MRVGKRMTMAGIALIPLVCVGGATYIFFHWDEVAAPWALTHAGPWVAAVGGALNLAALLWMLHIVIFWRNEETGT